MKSTPAHSSYNEDLLAAMPQGLRKVVEVGCSTGNLARTYLAQNPLCDYQGIEVDTEQADIARQNIRVRVSDIETFVEEDWKGFQDTDLWVFGDVLEHLVDPWEVLRQIRKVAGPDTRLLICIPNMSHWSVVRRLISGNLFYEPAGLLDQTHLRWFTANSITASLEVTGWEPVAGKARMFQEPDSKEFVAALGVLAKSLGWDKELVQNYSLVYQFIILAKPA
jgi:SAM-dependent methyltransferase